MDAIKKRFAVCILLGFAVIWTLLPQAVSAQTRWGDDLTIKIAVMGPGNELYFWWGHIGLVIEDARLGDSRFYDYGLFSFENDSFFVNFAFGRLWYSSGVSTTSSNIAAYIFYNRDIVLYTLDLPPEKREEIWRYAERSILPENRDYLYHNFKHNCAYPIIDIIDLATDGQFKEMFATEPGRFTIRQHVRRHTWFSPFLDWILNFWMGQNIDVPMTALEEMFLPSEVAARITNFTYIDSNDVPRPLVSEVEVVHLVEDRPPVLDIPRKQWPYQLVFSLFISLILGCLFFLQSKSAAHGQVALGIVHSLFGLFFGTAGLTLFFLVNFTSHDYAFNNANLFFCNPLLLAAFPLGIRYATSSTYTKRLRTECMLRLLWLLVALGILVSMVIKLFPSFWQQNLTDQMLMLPIALVLSLEPASLKRMMQRILWRWMR
ncbi:MAG: DUF4105 domain-containing protein [Treponema sp.]|nr:DUF4105 domain-containing protein [Treponema sp.]